MFDRGSIGPGIPTLKLLCSMSPRVASRSQHRPLNSSRMASTSLVPSRALLPRCDHEPSFTEQPQRDVQACRRKHEDRREVLGQALKWCCYEADETSRNAAATVGAQEKVFTVPVNHDGPQCA